MKSFIWGVMSFIVALYISLLFHYGYHLKDAVRMIDKAPEMFMRFYDEGVYYWKTEVWGMY